jgi:hypothetical protein
MENELIEDLTAELQITDKLFNASLLEIKVRNAIKEVKRARNYPSHYTEQMIDDDMERFYSQIRNIALYDYEQIGAENETSHSENNISRSFIDRDKLFAGILPLAKSR